MTAPDDVRARLLPLPAPTPMPPKRDGTYQRGYDADDMRDYGEACYRAAHADLSGEVRELVDADREYDEAQKAYGDSITKDTEVTRRALVRLAKACERRAAAIAKFTHQEKP